MRHGKTTHSGTFWRERAPIISSYLSRTANLALGLERVNILSSEGRVSLQPSVEQRRFRVKVHLREYHEQPGFPIFMLHVGSDTQNTASWWNGSRGSLVQGYLAHKEVHACVGKCFDFCNPWQPEVLRFTLRSCLALPPATGCLHGDFANAERLWHCWSEVRQLGHARVLTMWTAHHRLPKLHTLHRSHRWCR